MSSLMARIRSRKPHAPVRVNLDHPLGRNIAFFFHYVGGNSFYDAVSQQYFGTAAGMTQLNKDIAFNGAARASNTTIFRNPAGSDAQNIMVMGGAVLTTKPGGKCAFLSWSDAGASRGAHCGFDSNGFAGGGVFTTTGMAQSLDAVDHTGLYTVCAGSIDSAGGSSQGWVNGVKQTANFSGVISSVVPTTVFLGRDATNYFSFFTGNMLWGLGLNTYPLDVIVPRLMGNPWQLLEPLPNPLFFFSVPGGGGGTTYNESVAETGSGADTLAALAAFASAVAEAGAGADTVSNTAVLPSARVEAASAVDTPSSTAVLPSSVGETSSLADAPASTAVLPSAVGEVGGAAETVSNTAILPSAVVENAAASDTENGLPGNLSTMTEAASAVDVVSAQLVAGAAVGESAALVDARSAVVVTSPAIAETAVLADLVAAQANFAAALVELGFAADLPSAKAIMYSGVLEAGVAVDSPSADAAKVKAARCNTLGSAARIRVLGSTQRIRVLGGDCC